jgi:type IV secretory pathway VirB6-like protein
MKKLNKCFALLFFVLFFFAQQYKDCYANDNNVEIDALQEQGGGYFATKANCTSGFTEIVIGVLTIYVAGKNFILPAVLDLVFRSLSPIQKAIAGVQIGIGASVIMGVSLGMSSSLQCFFSFVMDPRVTKNDDGTSFLKSYIDKNDNQEKTKSVSNRWEADYAKYSSSIRVCARPIMIPYVNLVGAGKSFSCYGTNSDWSIKDVGDNPFYDGEKTFLCPEEWRFHGYGAELKEDPRDNKKERYATLGNKQTEEDAIGDEKKETLAAILDMKRHIGPLSCENHKIGDKFTLHGFQYTIRRYGAKLCAQLEGLGGVSLTGNFIVGCQYGPPAPPAPMCEASEEEYIKNPNGTNALDPITGKPIHIGWDNSKCFSCYVSDSCYNKSKMHSKAVVPISSYIMECLHSTLDKVMFGCENSQGGKDEGMLYIANKNFQRITYLALVLSVIFFAIKILSTNVFPKLNETFLYILKIGVVVFFSNGMTEDSGMHWFYKQLTSISGGLGDILLRASSFRNDVCNFTDDMYKSVSQQGGSSGGNTSQGNYVYLKPFDLLDCRVFLYLGGALIGNDQSIPANFGDLLTQAAPRLLMIIFPLFGILDPIAILLSFLLLLFAILVISIAVWVVSLMILALFVLFFLVFISPLVVPMWLFSYTKNIFDSWIKELIGYCLFPPFIFLLFGFITSIFDTRMLGTTQFEAKQITILDREAYYYAFKKIQCTSGSNDPRCKSCSEVMVDIKDCDGCDPKALVCRFRGFNTSKSVTLWGQGNIIPEKSNEFFVSLLESVGYILLMAVIFVSLLNTIAFLIARLTGGPRSIYTIIRYGVSPMTTFGKLTGKLASFTFGPTKKLWKNLRGSSSSPKSESDGKLPGMSTGSKK